MLKHNTEADPAQEFAAFLAIDWADQEHAFHLQVVSQSKIETGTLEQKPHVLAPGWPSCASAAAAGLSRWGWNNPGEP